jgi:hypothetical protein
MRRRSVCHAQTCRFTHKVLSLLAPRQSCRFIDRVVSLLVRGGGGGAHSFKTRREVAKASPLEEFVNLRLRCHGRVSCGMHSSLPVLLLHCLSKR